MTNNIIAINKQTHKDTKIKQDESFKHTANQQLGLLQVHEFSHSAPYYPIVFVKDVDSGLFGAVVMLGLEPNQNLFHSSEGWAAEYVPNSLKGYPILLGPDGSTLYIDEDSDLVSLTEGHALFNADGSESSFLSFIKDIFSKFINQSSETRNFISHLSEKKLLKKLALTIKDESKKEGSYEINGIYVVDNESLLALSDKDFITLKEKNYLAPIYAHLISLNTVGSLISRKNSLGIKNKPSKF